MYVALPVVPCRVAWCSEDRDGFYPHGTAKRQGMMGQCDILLCTKPKIIYIAVHLIAVLYVNLLTLLL